MDRVPRGGSRGRVPSNFFHCLLAPGNVRDCVGIMSCVGGHSCSVSLQDYGNWRRDKRRRLHADVPQYYSARITVIAVQFRP